MKFIKILVLLLTLAVVAVAAPVLVQQKIGTNTNVDRIDILLDSSTVTGNSLIVIVTTSVPISGDDPGAGAVALECDSSEIQMSLGVQYNPGNAGNAIQIWYGHNLPADNCTDVLITATGFATDPRLSGNVEEWSGLANVAPATTSTNNALSSTVTTGSVIPGTATNLIIAGAVWTTNNYSSGPINGFTRLTQTGGTTAYQESAYIIQSSANSKSTGWSLTLPIAWAAVIAAFNAPASGPTNAQRGAGFFMPPNEL